MDGYSHGHGLWDGELGIMATNTGGDVLAACLVAGGCFIGFAGHRFSNAFVPPIGGIIVGVMMWNEVVPQFEHDMVVCYVTSIALILLGAVIGGIVALLLRWACLGMVLGALVSLWLIIADKGMILSSGVLVGLTFAMFIAFGLVLSFFKETHSNIAGFAMLGGLMFASGIDLLLNGGLVYNVSVVLQKRWPEGFSCQQDKCHLYWLLAIWAVFFVFSGFIQVLSLSSPSPLQLLKNFALQFKGEGYESIPDGMKERMDTTGYEDGSKQRTLYYPDNQGFNYFNPDDLPPVLKQDIENIYHAATLVANFFGFQDDNVRNQTEHCTLLLLNYRRSPESPTLSANDGISLTTENAIYTLHKKVFENYREWCDSLQVLPNFYIHAVECSSSENSFKSEKDGLLLDALLYLCIWGEAANLRHMPECLCFLYHKTLQDFVLRRENKDGVSLYAGYFLDHVITPIWETILKSHVNDDHVKAKNYDDFDEFFWSPICLSYLYCSVDGTSAGAPTTQKSLSSSLPPISKGLAKAPKTFLEKRSILSVCLSFSRILEFHIVTFHMLIALSFAHMLIWPTYYSVQIFSSVLITVNFLPLLWCMLEVWQVCPGMLVTGTASVGFIARLCTRFIILTYQVQYFLFSVNENPKTPRMQAQGTPVFWWWQYIWISIPAILPQVFELVWQVLPSLGVSLGSCKNDVWQAFRNISYPASRLYVGQRIYSPFLDVLGYIFFWGTLIAFKMWFSYNFEVRVLVLPTVEIFDDYCNLPNKSFMRAALLVVCRWIPQFLIYLIDTSIWYALWSSFAGIIIGFHHGLGEVQDFSDIRDQFMKIPKQFCSKLIPKGAVSHDTSLANLSDATPNTPSESTRLLAEETTTKVLPNDSKSIRHYVAQFLDNRTQVWAAFAAVWNEVINQMRLTDSISNTERDILKFHSFSEFSKPVYLPIFQMAGCVDQASSIITGAARQYNNEEVYLKRIAVENAMVHRITSDVNIHEALSETWELGCYVIQRMLGPVHDTDMHCIVKVLNGYMQYLGPNSKDGVFPHLKMELLPAIVSNMTAMVTTLHQNLGKRAKNKGGTKAGDGENTLKINSSGSSNSLQQLGASRRRDNLKPFSTTSSKVIPDKTKDLVRDRLRPLLHTLKTMVKQSDESGSEVIDRVSYVLNCENGFMMDDAYACGRLDRIAEDVEMLSILSKLYGLLAIQASDAEPISPEARRRLSFFVNTLFMDIPNPRPFRDTMSWTCLTPYYCEDVLYGRSDLECRNEDGLSTLMYLQALYKHDWHNFLQRLGIEDEQQVWSRKFFQETRMWASLRSQTLSRTVEGIMYSEAALRLLANLEKIQPNTVEDLVKAKFQYVVSCQVYGRMVKSQDPKADDINFLLRRFPNLRVAYIDENRISHGGAPDCFSVLVKASENREDIEEVYRIRLPGYPVIGEGKPENQNHAIIFTRGEYLQVMDMNQEGYFEEALKMRCLLEEFSKPTVNKPPITILGFREHIFTGSVSSLANYMALQELSFVTLGQRVLNEPLRTRMHYGHPDIFDKLFFLTRGGVSKASKGINLSEDVFAGYNNTLRGGQVEFKEYLQVGKGRDVGMQQIYKFEAKLAQGAAEQCLSRDVNRLGNSMDYFRLISFYFGGLGYYIGNFTTVLLVTFVVYFMLGIAVFEAEQIGERKITPEGTLQMLLAGMGVLNTFPMLATLTLEKGLNNALRTVGQVFVSGGPMYFMFHIQTRAHYFYQTLTAGGTQYRATGRGFVTHHSTFDDIYRFFATSHFYIGFELCTALVIIGLTTNADQYIGRTWSLWLAAVSFLLSPFWFNPLCLDWSKVVQDYRRWMRWILGSGGSSTNSWGVWWCEENEYLKHLPLGLKLQCLIKPLVYVVIGLGIASPKLSSDFAKMTKHDMKEIVHSLCAIVIVALMYFMISVCSTTPWIRRGGKLVVSIIVAVGVIKLAISHYMYVTVLVGIYYIISAFSILACMFGVSCIRHVFRIHDFVLGHILFAVLFLLAGLQVPKDIQTWLLFHNALSQGVVMEDILKYARHRQEASALDSDTTPVDDTAELKKIIKHQEYMMSQLLQLKTEGSPKRNKEFRDLKATGKAQLEEEGSSSDSLTKIGNVEYLGDRGDQVHVKVSGMMKASTSTLNFSKLAVGRSKQTPLDQKRKASPRDSTLSQEIDTSFVSPDIFPPRGSA